MEPGGTEGEAYWTPVRVLFWTIMPALLAAVAILWVIAWSRFPLRGSDKAHCVMNQRNLQQAVRHHQQEHDLQPGSALDWSKLIGPGFFLESRPSCPVHGAEAYSYAGVIPELGTLAAPCHDTEHRPPDITGW